jgi:GPH family glycoside/pentoside/hexuronide:cation symporter
MSGSVALAQAPCAEASSLPLGRKAALASADFGLNLTWHSLELFLLFYYTDVVGLSPVFAGFILTCGSIWDAVFDAIIGSLADRTRTRWGRFRPWVVGAGPLIAIGLGLCFTKPDLGGAALTGYCLASHLFLRTAYTAGAVPFISLSARVTRDPRDRSTIAGLRMQFAGFASLAVAFTYPVMQDWAGPGREPLAFSLGAFLLGLAAIPVIVNAMYWTREPDDADAPLPTRSIRAIFADDLRALSKLRHNGAFVRVVAAAILFSTAGTLISKLTLFYYKYYAGAPEMGRYALATSALSLILIAPLWALVANRTSKRTAWMMAAAVGSLGLLGLNLIPVGQPVLALLLFFIIGAATTGMSVLFWAMLPDTVEVNEMLFGDRLEAKTIGIALFARKLTLAFNAILIGAVLEASGFVANAVQTPETVGALHGLIVYVPLACIALTVVTFWRYDLNARRQALLQGRSGGL